MGQDLKTYKGAVLFVDILGFAVLTDNSLKVKREHIAAWMEEQVHPYTNQFLAASILVEFRAILQQLQAEFPKVRTAQLSDSFFAWSGNLKEVVRFTHCYMHISIEKGLLSRGGLAQGEIIETEQSHSLGRLILGKAVTTAVSLEKPAKGARILIDADFPYQLHKKHPDFAEQLNGFFAGFENPLDFRIYDEFRWYLTDDLKKVSRYNILRNTACERIGFTKKRLRLINHLLHHPRFGWNAASPLGIIHLQATVNFMSANGITGVEHDFAGQRVTLQRSMARLEKANQVVDKDEEYIAGKNT